jgi:molecular chaperone GrpE
MSELHTPGGDEHDRLAAPKLVVRDRRRVDPATGTLRPSARESAPGGATTPPGAEHDPLERLEASAATTKAAAREGSSGDSERERLEGELAERTADLKRLTAEYANYRKRSERERELMTEQGVAIALASLLPVLDDIERARQHGDLTGGFAGVAEQLAAALDKLGLTAFAEPGDVFDPTWHEAVAHQGSGDEPHIASVLRRGYAIGDKMLRAALVVVGDPPTEAPRAVPGADEGGEP